MNPGWYNEAVTVIITATDELAGIEDTAYKLDDGDWQPCAAPAIITTGGWHNLQIQATDRAENENEAAVSFGVDAIPPVTAHHLSGTLASDGWYATLVTVTLVMSDVGSTVTQTLYRLNGETEWHPYSEAFVVEQEGVNALEYYSTDYAGNEESVKFAAFKIDLTPATAFAAIEGNPGSNNWYVSPITITLTAVDEQAGVERIEYDWRNSGWLTCTAPLTANDEGVHSLAYRAVDETGHVEATQHFTAMLDFSPPELVIQPVPVMTYSTITLSDIYTAGDSVSGIDDLTATIGGQEVQIGQSAPLGTNTLIVTATNGAGLQTTDSQTIVVKGMKVYLPLIIKPVCEWGWPYC